MSTNGKLIVSAYKRSVMRWLKKLTQTYPALTHHSSISFSA